MFFFKIKNSFYLNFSFFDFNNFIFDNKMFNPLIILFSIYVFPAKSSLWTVQMLINGTMKIPGSLVAISFPVQQ